VGYIVRYAGATPKVSSLQIVIYTSSGNVYSSGHIHKLPHTTGTFADYFYYNPHFAGGAYKMKLLANGKADGSTSFSVTS
jgi:hypothetical protein